MLSVQHITPLENGLLHVILSDERRGVFDIKPYCRSDFFKELLDDDYFSKVQIFFRGIGWPHGQDIGPDTIAADLVCTEMSDPGYFREEDPPPLALLADSPSTNS